MPRRQACYTGAMEPLVAWRTEASWSSRRPISLPRPCHRLVRTAPLPGEKRPLKHDTKTLSADQPGLGGAYRNHRGQDGEEGLARAQEAVPDLVIRELMRRASMV